METLIQNYEPLLRDRFIVKFFSADGEPIAIEPHWVRTVRLRNVRNDWEVNLELCPDQVLHDTDFEAIKLLKIFFVNASGDVLGSYLIGVQDRSWILEMGYTSAANMATAENGGLLTYKIQFIG